MMTQIRGISSARARRELGWAPVYASWRDGFSRGLGRQDQAGLAAAAGSRDRDS
jgi:hypothetical protein